MKNTRIFKRQLKTSILLIAVVLMSVSINFSIDNSNVADNSNLISEDKSENGKNSPIIKPITSDIGDDEWWNTDFEYRTVLNITNPGLDDFVDNIGVSINFNYSKLVAEGKMNSSLKDLRIVENGQLRKYYIQKDIPDVGNATVWIECNVSAGASDYDTYMYYGNNSLDYDDDYLMDYNPMGVAWFRFDKGSGNSVKDSIDGASHTFGLAWANWASSSAVGSNCLDFGGASVPANGINLGDLSKLKITGNQTIAMWMAPDLLWARQNPYGKAYGGEGTITLETSGSLSYYYGQGGGNTIPYQGFGSGSGTVVNDTWQHVAIVRDLTNMQLRWYKDGIIHRSGAAVYSPATNSTLPATIGDNYVSGFDGRIDDLRIYDAALSYDEIQWLHSFNYTIDATALLENEQGAEVNIVVRDVDGRPVPNAIVFLDNGTDILFNQTSDDEGIAEFSVIPYGSYNITVNYSLPYGDEAVVYNSTDAGETIEFEGLYETKTVYTDLWTIDFEVDDWDEDPLSHGIINVSKIKNDDTLETLTLDSEGKATFRWLNDTSYYYEVYYNNIDYFKQYTLINSSTVMRQDLLKQVMFDVNKTANILGFFYNIDEDIYANGSSSGDIGKTRIIDVKIELKNMTDNLVTGDIYYKDSTDSDNLLLHKDYTSETEDSIELDIIDNYDAYGVRILFVGFNSSGDNCNGTIYVNISQTTHQYIKTNMSKITIRVDSVVTKSPVPGVVVHVFNGTDNDALSIVNLTTAQSGYAYGQNNDELEFWYLHDDYNFTLEFFSPTYRQFDVNYTDPGQWNATNVFIYNYTLMGASTIIYELAIDTSGYMTNFTFAEGVNDVMWGDNMTYNVSFVYKTDIIPWTPITSPDTILCSVYIWGATPILLYTETMTQKPLLSGNFTVAINSSKFSAGNDYKSYMDVITGSKSGYSDPIPKYFPITINALTTDLSLHNYSSNHEVLINDEVSQYYNELVNVSVSYYALGDPNNRLRGATLSYDWDYIIGSGEGNFSDDLYAGYYTFTINTSAAPNIGKYGIDIIISKENYSTIEDRIDINILTRPTEINGTTKLLHKSEKVWVIDAHNFTFEYNDTTFGKNERLGDLEEAYYYWYKLDKDGNRDGPISDNIDLRERSDKLYDLDFNTSIREVGDYVLFVTLKKLNYEAKNALIDLRIEKREIDKTLTAKNLVGTIINVIQGEDVVLTIDLKDKSRNNQDLTGAKVILEINGKEYEFEEIEDGKYELVFSTADIDAFFLPNTITGNITISKENFKTEDLTITIVVGMVEIFPGMPMFYFLMVVGAIAAVVIALVSYRAIQQAKIPKFIKKVRNVKSAVQGRKSISESDLYPIEKEYIAKKFGDLWEFLGLSLADIEGIGVTKGKELPKVDDKIDKTGGGAL